MVRTLIFAGLMTLFGTTSSVAQYEDSAPPDDGTQYDTESTYDNYDEELLGSPDYRNRDDHRGYSEPDIDVGIFGSLGSDGSWHFAAGFGWVWRPYAHAGWRPYSNGRWVWTSYGWTWVSYEPFGWATYHYGYWARDSFLGWVWIPGYDWTACRVRFAYYDDYIAWTPLPLPGYYCPQPWSAAGISVWFTIGARHFCDPYPVRYCETPTYKPYYAERVAYKSPDRRFVERYTGAPVRTATVAFKNKSYNGGAKYSGAAKYSSKPDRAVMKSRVNRESPVARAARPSKQQFKGDVAREQRSIQKPKAAEHSSRSSMQASRSSSSVERKAAPPSKKTKGRDVANVKRSESGGKGGRSGKAK